MAYRHYFLSLVTLVLGIVAYWSGLVEIVSRWNEQAAYSHGYIIPFIVLYILWERLPTLREAMNQPAWIGLVIISIALAGLIIGELSALYILLQYSFILFLVGWAFVTIGDATRYIIVPLAMLLLVIPLPYIIEVALSSQLQLWSSTLGVEMIRAFNIPVFLEGNSIDLGDYQLQVVEACSGLNYLFPLMSLGLVIAYFYQAPLWKRLLLIVATIPITVLMNSLRIAIVGISVEYGGIQLAEGILHDFEGWVIFILCTGILLGLVWLLEKWHWEPQPTKTVFSIKPISQQLWNMDYNRTINYWPLWSACGLMLMVTILLPLLDREHDNTVRMTELSSIPLQIGEWRGKRALLSPQISEKLGADATFLANYTQQNKAVPVNLYIAHYHSQRKGVSPHSPRVCIPGGGWEIRHFQRVTIEGHPANQVIIQKGHEKQLVYYWFFNGDQVIANEYVNKWYLFQNALWHNRTDGSLVRYITPIMKNESLEEADNRVKSLIQQTNRVLYQKLLSVGR